MENFHLTISKHSPKSLSGGESENMVEADTDSQVDEYSQNQTPGFLPLNSKWGAFQYLRILAFDNRSLHHISLSPPNAKAIFYDSILNVSGYILLFILRQHSKIAENESVNRTESRILRKSFHLMIKQMSPLETALLRRKISWPPCCKGY